MRAPADGARFGAKIPPAPNQPCFRFEIADEAPQQLWIDAIVDLLTNPKTSELAVNGAARLRQCARPRIAVRRHDVLRG